MNPTSALQQQFPLSSRKYWKKMFPKLIGVLFIPLIFFIPAIIVIVTVNNGNNTAIEIIGAVVISLVIYLIIIAPYSWYVRAYIKRYYYAGEDHFITIKKGVFTPAEIHVQWQKIQDVYVDQDLLDRMMGLYDVHIASATMASGMEAHIDGVDQTAAEGLKKFFLDKVSSAGMRGNVPLQAQNAQPSATSSESVSQPQPQAQNQPQTQSQSVHFAEEISSNTYPLSNKWLAVETVNRLIAPFIYWAFLALLFLPSLLKDLSWQTTLPYVVLCWVGVSILSGIIHIITLFIWRKNYAFNFGPDNLYYKGGVISLSEKHMPYSSIQDVTIRQGILDRFFGLADVRVENAAQQMIQTRRGAVPVSAGIVLQGFSLANANKITDILKTTLLGRNSSQSQYGL